MIIDDGKAQSAAHQIFYVFRSLPLCTGPECVTSSKLSPPPSGSPPTPSYPETGNISQESKHNDTSIKNGFSTDESTAQPHKDKSTEKGINLGMLVLKEVLKYMSVHVCC